MLVSCMLRNQVLSDNWHGGRLETSLPVGAGPDFAVSGIGAERVADTGGLAEIGGKTCKKQVNANLEPCQISCVLGPS